MGRESRLNHPNSRPASRCSKARRLFLRARGQKLHRGLRSKQNRISRHAGDEGTSSQTPLENVETVLDVFREALRECSARSCVAVLGADGGRTQAV
jgi:hypothetical protein